VLPGLVTAAAATVVAPRPLRPAARAGLGLYGAAVFVEGVRAAREPRDALALPLVFATMHFSWGAGFLAGLVRFAPPSTRRPALADELVERARN
jgi:succinoglycan biosynthesis protein ExoA